jgi:hypothetical protein
MSANLTVSGRYECYDNPRGTTTFNIGADDFIQNGIINTPIGADFLHHGPLRFSRIAVRSTSGSGYTLSADADRQLSQVENAFKDRNWSVAERVDLDDPIASNADTRAYMHALCSALRIKVLKGRGIFDGQAGDDDLPVSDADKEEAKWASKLIAFFDQTLPGRKDERLSLVASTRGSSTAVEGESGHGLFYEGGKLTSGIIIDDGVDVAEASVYRVKYGKDSGQPERRGSAYHQVVPMATLRQWRAVTGANGVRSAYSTPAYAMTHEQREYDSQRCTLL